MGLRREGERYLLWKRCTNVPAKLSEEEQQSFDEATHCARCKAKFGEDHPYSGPLAFNRGG